MMVNTHWLHTCKDIPAATVVVAWQFDNYHKKVDSRVINSNFGGITLIGSHQIGDNMIFSVSSQKGGVGKSTTAISLSAGLAHQGHKALLIDIDSQANASKVLLPNYPDLKKEDTIYATIIDRKPLPVLPTVVPNLDMVASHILLSSTDVQLSSAMDHREARLKTELDKIKDRYEYIFIDCPPSLGWLVLNAFTAADQTIIVVSPGYFELDSTVQIRKTIQEVQNNFNPELRIKGFLFTMADSTINSRESLKILRQTYTDEVLASIIPRNTDLRDAHFNRQDIFTFNEKSIGAAAYSKLIKELLS